MTGAPAAWATTARTSSMDTSRASAASSCALGVPEARAVNATEIVCWRGSRAGSEYTYSNDSKSTCSPVSSRASRTAASGLLLGTMLTYRNLGSQVHRTHML